MADDGPTPGGGLLHPVALGAIALLLFNDHWAKAAVGGWIPGKLSDVAGLVFFPLMLQAAFEVVLARVRPTWAPSQRLLAGCVVATGVVFASVQLWDPAGQAYRWGLGGLQWPFHALGALLGGGPPPSLAPVLLEADPTDLIALPALGLAWWAGRRRTAVLASDRVDVDRR